MPGNLVTLITDDGDSVNDETNDALRVNVVAGGAGGGITTDIQDGTGDSAMDAANNALRVNVVAGSGSGLAVADDADFTAGTSEGVPAMGVYESTPTNVTDGDQGTVGITVDRKLKVQADLGATDNAVLDAIAASVAAIDSGQLADSHNVTIDNAAGASAVNVQDGGNSLTVDGTVTVTATNLDVRDIDAATDDITVHGDVGVLDQLDLANSNPAAVAIVDGDGTQITSFGGGTQYTEGDTDASITGTALLWEDAADTLVAASAAKPLPISDAGGTLTVDGTVTVTATNLDIRDIDAATDDITIHGDVGIVDQMDLTNANPLTVAIVDGDGTQITSFGGGTQYTEGDTDASITGTALLFEGAADTLVAAQGTAANGLEVDVTRVAGTVTVDGSGVTQPVSGTVTIQDGGNVITVDGTVAVTGVATEAKQDTEITHLATIAGDTTDIETAVELIDDTVVVLGTATYTETTSKGLAVGAVRRDADTTLVGTTNEWGPLQMDANGRLKVEVFDGGDSHTIDGTVTIQDGGNSITVDGSVSVSSLPASTNTLEVVGDAAADAAAAGNPVAVGVVQETMADSAPSTRVSADADIGYAAASDGAQYVIPTGPQTWSYHENSSSALTDTSVHAAPGAGLSLYVTDIIVSTGAATAFNIFFEEGSTTVLGPYYLEAVAGRGFQVHFQSPKKITANTALTVTTSAAIAHGIDVTGFIARG